MRPKRSTVASDGSCCVLGLGDVERAGEQVIGLAEGGGDGRGVASGRDDGVAGRKRGLRDIHAHAAARRR